MNERARAHCGVCGLHFLYEDDYWDDNHLMYCDGNKDYDELQRVEDEGDE